jgi:hypothetical protein
LAADRRSARVHGHRPPQLSREGVLRIDAGGQRSDLVGGKAHGGLADRVSGFAELKAEAVTRLQGP